MTTVRLHNALYAVLAQANPIIPGGAGGVPGGVPGGAPATPTGPGAQTTTTAAAQFPTVLLTALVFSSLAIALIIAFMPERTRDQRGRIRILGLVGAAIPMLFALGGLNFQVSQEFSGGTIAFEEKHPWITGFPIHADYHLGVDGISLPLLMLSTVLFTVAVLAAWRNDVRPRLFYVLLLVLETGVNGTLCSLDYVLFMLFWAMELVPTFLLIAVYGGAGRARAAQRYLAYGLTSTALLIASFLLLGYKSQQGSFDFDLANTVTLTKGLAYTGFWLAFVAFAIRLPVVPLHTWMVDATAEASPPVSMIISGVVLKLGGYGLLRICLTAFPSAAGRFSLVLAVLAAVGAVWGFAGALGQHRIRRLIAYSNVGQMAVVLLAISTGQAIALNGAVLMMVAHGFGVGLLTLLAGTLEERARTDDIHRLGGLAWQMPRLTALWVVGGLTVIGVPFFAGFAAELMVYTGSFPVHRVTTVIVLASTALTTGYVLWMLQRAFFGPARETFARLKDATTLELFYLVPVAIFALALGLFPGRLMPIINNGVLSVAARITGG